MELSIATALAALPWLLYWPMLRLWWTFDDLFHQHLLVTGPRLWYLWDAEFYRHAAPKMMTPLLFLSLDLDRRLFGLHPVGFYAHQLVSLSLVGAALYAVLRLWLPRGWSALGSGLFLLGAPVAGTALQLMVRHYFEALVLMAVAVALWVGALRGQERRAPALAWASAAVWFLACLAKEIAVPLVLFLPLVPEVEPRGRGRLFFPYGVAAVAYAALRVYLLGGPAPPSGFAVSGVGWLRLAMALPAKVATSIGGLSGAAGWGLLATVLAGLVAALALGRGSAFRTGAGLALAMAPVLPVSTVFEPRFALMSWLAVAIAGAFAGAAWSTRGQTPRRAAIAVALVAVGLGALVNRQAWADGFGESLRRSAEGRYFVSMKAGELVRRPAGLPAELGELRWFREQYLGLPRGAGWFLDDLYLCLHPETGPVAGWDALSRRMVDLTWQVPAIRHRYCEAIRWRAPLRVEIRAEGAATSWDLGPYGEGQYDFVWEEGTSALAMPRVGSFHARLPSDRALRVRYQAPEGWVTYSPDLTVDLARSPLFRWSR